MDIHLDLISIRSLIKSKHNNKKVLYLINQSTFCITKNVEYKVKTLKELLIHKYIVLCYKNNMYIGIGLLTVPKHNGKEYQKMLEITNLFVVKRFRGKKVSNIILNYILMNYLQYKKLNRYGLCALPINNISKHLFEKCGFSYNKKNKYYIY